MDLCKFADYIRTVKHVDRGGSEESGGRQPLQENNHEQFPLRRFDSYCKIQVQFCAGTCVMRATSTEVQYGYFRRHWLKTEIDGWVGMIYSNFNVGRMVSSMSLRLHTAECLRKSSYWVLYVDEWLCRACMTRSAWTFVWILGKVKEASWSLFLVRIDVHVNYSNFHWLISCAHVQ